MIITLSPSTDRSDDSGSCVSRCSHTVFSCVDTSDHLNPAKLNRASSSEGPQCNVCLCELHKFLRIQTVISCFATRGRWVASQTKQKGAVVKSSVVSMLLFFTRFSYFDHVKVPYYVHVQPFIFHPGLRSSLMWVWNFILFLMLICSFYILAYFALCLQPLAKIAGF